MRWVMMWSSSEWNQMRFYDVKDQIWAPKRLIFCIFIDSCHKLQLMFFFFCFHFKTCSSTNHSLQCSTDRFPAAIDQLQYDVAQQPLDVQLLVAMVMLPASFWATCVAYCLFCLSFCSHLLFLLEVQKVKNGLMCFLSEFHQMKPC